MIYVFVEHEYEESSEVRFVVDAPWGRSEQAKAAVAAWNDLRREIDRLAPAFQSMPYCPPPFDKPHPEDPRGGMILSGSGGGTSPGGAISILAGTWIGGPPPTPPAPKRTKPPTFAEIHAFEKERAKWDEERAAASVKNQQAWMRFEREDRAKWERETRDPAREKLGPLADYVARALEGKLLGFEGLDV